MIKFDAQIAASLGQRLRYPELRLGIELEYERMRADYPLLDFWMLERDASLRNNGVEFISIPLLPKDIPKALEEAQERITEYKLDASWRCGGHTHVNVSYWTWKQLFSLSALYCLVEPYLFGNWAQGREKNHFCVPMWANTNLIDRMANDAERLRAGRGTARQLQTGGLLSCSKYSALNFKPIWDKGTIEFRHLPATTDMEHILRWCEFLQRMVEVAHEFERPDQIILEYEDLGIDRMLELVGLHTCDVDPIDVEDGYIAASLVCGHDPRRWQDLNWDLDGMEEEEPVVQLNQFAEQLNPQMWYGERGQDAQNIIGRHPQQRAVRFDEAARIHQEDFDRMMAILEGDE